MRLHVNKTRKSNGPSCRTESIIRAKLANFSLNIIYFGSKFLVSYFWCLLNTFTKFQQVS